MNDFNYSNSFKRKLLETMKAFDFFCKKNEIDYVAAYGTVIGAVRHKGLIPWDDDIDVFMDWKNYNRFLSLRANATKIGCCVIDRKDYGYYLPMAKFVDMESTIWEHKRYPYVYGVYIDVFPLGYVNSISDSKKIHEKYKYHSLQLSKGYRRFYFKQDLKYFLRFPIETVDCFIERSRISYHQLELNKLDAVIANISSGDYCMYYRSMDSFEHSLFMADWFKKSIRVPFEDFEISIPEGYHEYLSLCYGDYMTLPPIEKQISHHSHYYLNLKEKLNLDQIKDRIQQGEHLVY